MQTKAAKELEKEDFKGSSRRGNAALGGGMAGMGKNVSRRIKKTFK